MKNPIIYGSSQSKYISVYMYIYQHFITLLSLQETVRRVIDKDKTEN